MENFSDSSKILSQVLARYDTKRTVSLLADRVLIKSESKRIRAFSTEETKVLNDVLQYKSKPSSELKQEINPSQSHLVSKKHLELELKLQTLKSCKRTLKQNYQHLQSTCKFESIYQSQILHLYKQLLTRPSSPQFHLFQLTESILHLKYTLSKFISLLNTLDCYLTSQSKSLPT